MAKQLTTQQRKFKACLKEAYPASSPQAVGRSMKACLLRGKRKASRKARKSHRRSKR